MSRLREWVANGPLICDGAMGTELQARGLQPGELGDAWSLTHPDRVETVIREYCEAGSRVVSTNTFRSNPITLADYSLADRLEQINHAGVEISRRAVAARPIRVVASMGPSGKMLVTGDVTPERLREVFTLQANALAESRPDAIILETMSDIEEARIAARAALATGLPVIACFVFDSGKHKDRTMMGATPEVAVKAMCEEGVDAVGSNCGLGIDPLMDVCRRMRAACDLPIWMKPNAGLPVVAEGRISYQLGPEEFAAKIPTLIEAGASLVGGCCGTSPAFIRAVSQCVLNSSVAK